MKFFNRYTTGFIAIVVALTILGTVAYADRNDRRNREMSFRYAGSLGSCRVYSSYDDGHVVYLTTGGCSIAIR